MTAFSLILLCKKLVKHYAGSLLLFAAECATMIPSISTMPYGEYGAKKEGDAMKKLFALLMALTMTFQLVTPAWADAVEEGPEETTEAVEVVKETTEATEETEEVPEETEAETKETEATEEVMEPEETTEEPTEETAEPTEIGEKAEDEQVAAVAALIEALPSVEELEGMTEEEQLAAYEQI